LSRSTVKIVIQAIKHLNAREFNPYQVLNVLVENGKVPNELSRATVYNAIRDLRHAGLLEYLGYRGPRQIYRVTERLMQIAQNLEQK